jgi:signal transduction histidine kinase
MLPDFRVRQREYLLEIAQAITQELNLDALLGRILIVSAELLAGQAALCVLRAERGGWSVAASHGIPAAFLRYIEKLLSNVEQHEDPARHELPEINRLLQMLTRSASHGWLTGVGLPLIVRQQVIGVIYVFRSYPGNFSANDQALLQSFGDQAAIAVYNARLYTQVSREKQRLDALLDSAADGILIIEPDHTVERCNPSFSRMIGLPVEEMIGKSHEEVIRWSGRVKGQTLEDAEMGGWPLSPGATLYVEGDMKRKGRPPLAVGITYSALMLPAGGLINILATVRDITHFREAEEVKSTFISIIGHELKTPVALIKGYVGTLRREDVSWDREIVQDSLAVIEEEADRLTELIENLLDASRLQAGALRINLSDVNLANLAKMTAARFRTQTSSHEIVVEFPANFPVILADENRVTQVLNNLISNAIKYSTGGGGIRINGQVHPEHVVVCVIDEGPGIAQKDVPFIFDRFYRSAAASRTTKGAGLGLFLARAVVEAHGGRIWVDPKPGVGAHICFSLPREGNR